MIELPHFATFAAAFNDPRFVGAVVVALLSGAVRGFAGFGAALIYVPLMAAVYEPLIATTTFVLIDFICVAPFALRALPNVRWREVLPALVAAILTVPLGTMVQHQVNPIILRWAMALFVLAFVILVATGSRYPWKPSTLAAIGAGAVSGFTGGAAQLSGPPLILYWLGSPSGTAIVRANLIVYLCLTTLTLMVSYAWQGLVTTTSISLAVLLWVPYTLALAVGARWFRGASELAYRRIAYVITALAALVSMPLFDHVLR